MYNTEFNKNLMKKISFPADAQYCFTKLFAAIDANGEWTADMEQAIQKYMFPMAENNEEALRRMNALAEKMQKPKYTLHMAFLICCAQILHDRYIEKATAKSCSTTIWLTCAVSSWNAAAVRAVGAPL